jgi:zinc transport system ATP-binding protein
MKREAIVRMTDVWVSYDEKPALEKVNLEIEEGEFLGLIGPNGSGKTTLIKVILGLLKPDRGTVEVFGVPPDKLGPKRRLIGYVPQKSQGDWNFPVSVFDVVMMGRYGHIGLFKRPTSADRAKVAEALQEVQMQDFARRQLAQLSGGQQQRVMIARALASQPRLLLMDEPSAGVDVHGEEQFYRLLERIKEERELTIVIVTHDVAVVSSYVEKLACLNRTLYSHAAPAEALTLASLEKVYGCEVELLAHGRIPHRVVEEHK